MHEREVERMSVVIGERLRKLRGSRTEKEVAAGVGITLVSLACYERGERIPRDEVKLRFATFYNVPIDSIFYS